MYRVWMQRYMFGNRHLPHPPIKPEILNPDPDYRNLPHTTGHDNHGRGGPDAAGRGSGSTASGLGPLVKG